MKSVIDENVMITQDSYDDFDRWQFIVDLDTGDKVKIQVFDSNNVLLTEKEFMANYINSNINCQWMDKGKKS